MQSNAEIYEETLGEIVEKVQHGYEVTVECRMNPDQLYDDLEDAGLYSWEVENNVHFELRLDYYDRQKWYEFLDEREQTCDFVVG